jgi:hypothetical protein
MPVLDSELILHEAVAFDIMNISAYLQAALGQKLTAYIAGVNDPKMVGRWALGRVQPRATTNLRLREAYKATRMLVEAYDATTAKAWWVGTNTRLDDHAPAAVLRNANDPEAARFVAPAARAFAGGPA